MPSTIVRSYAHASLRTAMHQCFIACTPDPDSFKASPRLYLEWLADLATVELFIKSSPGAAIPSKEMRAEYAANARTLLSRIETPTLFFGALGCADESVPDGELHFYRDGTLVGVVHSLTRIAAL